MNLINLKYGKNFHEDLLSQYQSFVKSSEEISSKRMNSNNFYLSLNTALLGIVGYLFYLNKSLIIILILSILGIIISLVWSEGISSYRELNSAKFKIIHEMENYLPSAPFRKEDEYLRSYYKITKIEKFVPWIFMGLYGLSFIVNIATFMILK